MTHNYMWWSGWWVFYKYFLNLESCPDVGKAPRTQFIWTFVIKKIVIQTLVYIWKTIVISCGFDKTWKAHDEELSKDVFGLRGWI